MSHYDNPHVKDIAREMFDDADTQDAHAAALPRWRWLKRSNLQANAQATRFAAALFMLNHKIPTVNVAVRSASL